jgi:hypothetical protein
LVAALWRAGPRIEALALNETDIDAARGPTLRPIGRDQARVAGEVRPR